MSYLTAEQLRKYSELAGRGKALSLINRIKDLEKRKQGKLLKVFAFPQNGSYVPAIKVSGLWLSYFGFEMDDAVILIANQNEIIIKKSAKGGDEQCQK